MRAECLEQYDEFKEQYRETAGLGQSSQQRASSHHFTAFVFNEDGDLIELDGIKQGPVLISKQCK